MTALSIGWSLSSSLILAIASGILAGIVWSYLLPILSDRHFWHVLTFAAVLLVYSGTHALRGNELVAVLVFGLTLSNFSMIRKRLRLEELPAGANWFFKAPAVVEPDGTAEAHQKQMLTFHGELSFLIRTFFFVLLGARVQLGGLWGNLSLALECFAALLLARWFAVQTGRLMFPDFTRQDRELMIWFVPRGLITAVLGIEVLEARGAQFQFLTSLAFATILFSNLILLIGALRARRITASLQAALARAAAGSGPPPEAAGS